jgi:hypothetical protein
VILHHHISPAGSLEGFVLLNGRRIAWSINADLVHRDPALLAEIVEHAKTLAAAPRVG